jgi:hypothetical protein
MKKATLFTTIAGAGMIAATQAAAICNITVESEGGFLTPPTPASAITHESMATIAVNAQSRGFNRQLGVHSWARPTGAPGVGATKIHVFPFSTAERQCLTAFQSAINNNPGRVVGASFLCRTDRPQTAISGGAPFRPECG